MSRWIIPIICLLLLTGSCGCRKSGPPASKCKYDPQQADQADSAIAELTQKMTDLQAEVTQLKKEKTPDKEETPDNQADVPGLDEVDAQADRWKAWQEVVDQFSKILQKHEKAIGELSAQLIQANVTAIQAKADLESAKQEFARVQKAANVPETKAAKEAVDRALEAAKAAEEKLKNAVKQSQEAVENSQKAAEESPIYKELQEQATELSKKWEQTEQELKKTNGTVHASTEFAASILVKLHELGQKVEGQLKELTEVDLQQVSEQLKVLTREVRDLEGKIKKIEENKGVFSGMFGKK